MSSNVDWHDTTTYLASSRVAARPIPLPAPVMAATRPSCKTGCMPSTGAMGFSNWRDAPGRRGEADGCRLPLTLSDMAKRRAGGRWRRRGSSGSVGRRRRQAGLYSSMTLGGYISAGASPFIAMPCFLCRLLFLTIAAALHAPAVLHRPLRSLSKPGGVAFPRSNA